MFIKLFVSFCPIAKIVCYSLLQKLIEAGSKTEGPSFLLNLMVSPPYAAYLLLLFSNYSRVDAINEAQVEKEM